MTSAALGDGCRGTDAINDQQSIIEGHMIGFIQTDASGTQNSWHAKHSATPLYDHIRVTSQNSFFADVSQLCLTYDPINRQHFLQSWRLPNSRVGSVSTSLRRRVICNGASLSRRSGKRTMSTLRFLTVVCAAVICTCSPRAGVRRLTVSCPMSPRVLPR